MPICPNGHQSETSDWCEVCGMRIAAPAAAYGSRPPSSASSASATPVSAPPGTLAGDPAAGVECCPDCGTPREGAALFCEECRYNFGTHAATAAEPPSPAFPPYQRYDSQRSRPSQINRPAEPVPSGSVTVTSGSGDFLLDPPSGPVRTGSAAGAPAEPPAAPASSAPAAPAAEPTAVVAAPSSSATAVPAASGPGTVWMAVIGAGPGLLPGDDAAQRPGRGRA